jgi:hypothetical protein
MSMLGSISTAVLLQDAMDDGWWAGTNQARRWLVRHRARLLTHFIHLETSMTAVAIL